ncbi:MAG: tetratricopeptide repeat protein [Oscillatoria princeps RMCB-10]|jgi:predicted O-linked N-acetylglucosamine transferase (SPINDLY family)|nr:tetratricopeptide repeat protein [Oscillatoria princeps RMCB-10]
MDIQRFIEQLPSFYENWGLPSVLPKSQRFQQVLDRVEGMTAANIMQLLNFAVGCMEPGEVYCEIGCLRGASLIGALLDHPEPMACAVDDFSEFDDSGENLQKLTENLAEFNLEDRVFFCQENFENFFSDLREIGSEEKIGVYYYDGRHDYRSQLLSLLLVRPFLADKALIIVSEANSESVQQATRDFLAASEQSSLLFNWNSDRHFSETFWNGIIVLAWEADTILERGEMNADSQLERQQSVIEAISNLQTERKREELKKLYKEATNTLYLERRYDEAERMLKTVLLHESANIDAWMTLGILYSLSQRYTEAIEALLKCLQIDASNAVIHYNLGTFFEKAGDVYQAIEAYRHAIDLQPNLTDACNNLGNILCKLGRFEEAESVIQKAISHRPSEFGYYISLGNLMMAQSKYDEAIEAYQKARSLKPDEADILYNLGRALEEKEDSTAYYYLGQAHFLQEELEDAVTCFGRFLETHQFSDENDCLIYAYCLNEYGHTQEALACLTDPPLSQPDNLSISIARQLILPPFYETEEEIALWRQRFIGGLEEVIETTNLEKDETLKQAVRAAGVLNIFYLPYQGYNDRELQRKYGHFIHEIMAANSPDWTRPLPVPGLDKNSKIRIGYISEQLGNTSGSKWALGWLKNRDRDKFEVYCYSTGSRFIDYKTANFKELSDYFYHIPNSVEAVCQQIRSDNLHVLVFLAIGMWAPTAQIAGLRLAPIQCTAWGHPVTSGLSTVDYFLSGDLLEPENAQDHYTEQLVRLPNLGISYPKPLIPNPTKNRSDFQLRDEAVVYLCCQSTFKYLPQYDFLYAEIARRVPRAQFVFVFGSTDFYKSNSSLQGRFRQRLQSAFAKVGLNSEDYCVFLTRQDWKGYTSLLLCSDVFLDTLSFSGGHTTFDAVACNLPIVTCPGEFMRGRQSFGILRMLGVTDTVAQNEAEYIEIAVRLGLDRQWRRDISQRMSQRHDCLYEDKICVGGLEQFYERVVLERLAQQETAPPQTGSPQKTVLHVGCGPYRRDSLHKTFRTEEWLEVRLDIDPSVKPDIIGTITDMSGVASEFADALYSSHNIEHVFNHEVPVALAEFYRVLKPGGFALITLPDIQKVAEYVAEGNLEDTLYVSPAGPIAAIDILYGLGEAIARGNHYMAHRTGFTAQSLAKKMQEAGFRDIEVRRENLDLWATGYK